MARSRDTKLSHSINRLFVSVSDFHKNFAPIVWQRICRPSEADVFLFGSLDILTLSGANFISKRTAAVLVNFLIIQPLDFIQRFPEQAGIDKHIFDLVAGVAVFKQKLNIGAVHAVATAIRKKHFFMNAVIRLII